jgi:hypothetical protein
MKKLYLIIIQILCFTLLFGCMPVTEVDYDLMYQEIKTHVPNVINHDFLLPEFKNNVDVTYRIDGISFKDIFIYQSPLYDQHKTLEIEIKSGSQKKNYELEIFVAAIDSGINQHVMKINIPISRNQITRDTYVSASMMVQTNRNDELVLDHMTTSVEIRGRGNSTWHMPKTPLRIRFSEDTEILGMPKARNYVLLAEYADKSLIRNTIAHKFASLLSHIEYAVSTRSIELYINDEYMGVYTLAEHVEVHQNKLWIESDYSILDTGYFIELNQRLFNTSMIYGLEWFNIFGYAYEIGRPNPLNTKFTVDHLYYIEDAFVSLEQALINKQGYEQLMDLDNFLHYFIAQELFKNVDVGYSSVFIYKRANDKIKMGPLWDFDLAFGNADYIDYGTENFYGFANNKNRWYHLMMQIPEVRLRYRQLYNEIYFDVIPLILEAIHPTGNSMSLMANRNFQRWQILDSYVWPNPMEVLNARTHQAQVDLVYTYLRDRSLWMYDAINHPNFLNDI